MALPLASYYAVTLAVPLANGAAQSGAFEEHALAVLVVPPVAIMLACTACTIAHALVGACRTAGARLASKQCPNASLRSRPIEVALVATRVRHRGRLKSASDT
jgi:hypothetical protein